MAHSSTLEATSAVMSIVPTSISIPTPSPMSSITGLPPLPSGFAKPLPKPEFKQADTAFMALLIAAVVIGGVLLLVNIGKIIYLVIKGGCSGCKDKDNQIQKYVTGQLTYISPATVRAREKLASHTSSSQASTCTAGPKYDVERGEAGGYAAQSQAAHEAALAAMQLPLAVTRSRALWGRLVGVFRTKTNPPWKRKAKGRATPPHPMDAPSSVETAGDRFFTIGDGEEPDLEAQHAPPLTPPRVHYELSMRRASSVYSQPTNVSRANRPFQTHDMEVGPSRPPRTYHPRDSHHDQPEPPHPLDTYRPRTHSQYLREDWEPRNAAGLSLSPPDNISVISSSLNIYDPRHKARYEEAQRIMADGDVPDDVLRRAVQTVNAVEKQRRPKRRSRTYGGLPHPDEIEKGRGMDLDDAWDSDRLS